MSNFLSQDDDNLFNPTSTSNLSSLFNTSRNVQEDIEASLSYTAPKQPKSNNSTEILNSSNSETQTSVICSKIVDVYKLVENVPVFEGKYGIAIIGCQSIKLYEIIIYKSKQDVFARSRLKADFLFIIEANNFVYFCDDQKLRWCIHFKNSQDLKEFSQKVEDNNGKIVHNNTENPVSSSSLTSSEVKVRKELIDSPVTRPIPVLPKPEETNSLSDKSTDITKANILSRMAKMGQSMLPSSAIPSPHNDIETDELQNKSQIKQKFFNDDIASDKLKNVRSEFITSSISGCVLPNENLLPVSIHTQNPINQQLIQHSFPNQIMWNQPHVMSISDPLNVFISENRTHNCEIRMNINQLSSKVDQVLSKLSSNLISSTEMASNSVDQQKQEAGHLLNYFKEEIIRHTEKPERIQQDNLNKDAEINSKIILEQDEKIKQLEEENLVLRRKLDLKNNLEGKVQELQFTLDVQQTSLQTLQKFYDEHKNVNIDNEKVFQLNSDVEKLQSQLNNINMKSEQFQTKLKESMSILYQQIIEVFNDKNKLDSNINSTLAKVVKNTTFTILKNVQISEKPENGSK